ncbi:helix-turn-helix transcriptional regulator [Streptomyces malaysiensis subsp. malaysiensis]|uniref:Helix-turn-helix domain-containing protein n=1 Tax=Streptomyces malaysiensis TaxID=92644 RepID=A0ABX6WDI2_STRMQ|nr:MULTISPECIES: helix-turn-helix transcriptional regulator [Streptomyces]QPI59467.1 helix-turn-helix domain-containing protein [Streptomyces solisilvae]UHH21120.1 helix-turn-helix domain-containing protein [Streptomyces sp. HNM0561]
MTFQPRELFPDRSARDLFGAEIRRHREKADMSLRRLSEVLNYSKSHLARIEAAESLPYDDLPAKLDACFGTDGLFARIYALAKNEPFPGKYRRMIEIEKRAAVIEQYVSVGAPGLLQTPRYAEALMRSVHPHAPNAEIEAMVKARIDRQARLVEPKPPRCWFILDEAVLRRPVGGLDVTCDQLAYLLKQGTQSHVSIQVLPFAVGEHPEMLGGVLKIYTVPGEPQVAYEEGSRSGALIEDQVGVAMRRENYDLLRAMALSPRDSEAMIQTAMEDYTPCPRPGT